MISRKNTRERLDYFGEHTTSHAIPDWYKAETRCGRFFWAAVFLIFTTVAVYEITIIVINYASSDKYTSQITQEPAEFLELPAISICYGIPWSKRAVERLNLSMDALEYLSQIFFAPVNRTTIFDKVTMDEMRVAYETWESSPRAQAYRISSNNFCIIDEMLRVEKKYLESC